MTSLREMREERERMLEEAPRCKYDGCDEPVVEQEVCATIRLPKYPEAPLGPLGDPKPAAYLSRCRAGHEVVRNVG